MNNPLIKALTLAIMEALDKDTTATDVANSTNVPANTEHPFEIGKNYFLRTATYHLTGRIVEVGTSEIVIEDAAWIGDSGRFMQAVESGEFSEVEPFPEGKVIVGRGALIDAVQIPILPRSQK
jgi:hypothetical protein